MSSLVLFRSLGLGLVLAAVVALPAEAASIRFDYNGTCSDEDIFVCSALGLADGGPVSGFIDILDSKVVPGGVITPSDLTAFGFSFGNVTIASASDARGGSGGTLDATASGFVSGGNLQLGGPGGPPTLSISMNGSWVAIFAFVPPFAAGTGQFTRSAPEPSPYLLISAGLGAVRWARRRRATDPDEPKPSKARESFAADRTEATL